MFFYKSRVVIQKYSLYICSARRQRRQHGRVVDAAARGICRAPFVVSRLGIVEYGDIGLEQLPKKTILLTLSHRRHHRRPQLRRRFHHNMSPRRLSDRLEQHFGAVSRVQSASTRHGSSRAASTALTQEGRHGRLAQKIKDEIAD